MKLFWASLRRFLGVSRILARHGVAHLLGSHAGRLPAAVVRRLRHWLPMVGQPGPERLRMLFEDLGGTFIKLGQMLALQPDILPVAYCNALFRLLDKVDSFGWDDVERIVREELGRHPDEIFDAIERRSLATASVGQVHVGWLDGRKVAVKVQRPNVEVEFWSDIRLMLGLIRVIRSLRLAPLYWMLEPMEEFVNWTREELDYRNEARCSESLRRMIEGRPGQYVPKVYDHLTTRRTLVVEFLEGVTLLDYLRAVDRGDEVLLHRLASRGFDRRRVASNVIDNFLANAFEHGVYHADLHPANLMILDGSVVGYIDFGITGVMNAYARRHLMRMTLALARGEMDLFHEQFLRVTTWGEDSDLEGFRAGLDDLSDGWYEDGPAGPVLAANFTRVMTEMLHLSRRTGVMPERNVIKYIRSSIAIDGLVTRFEPDFHLHSYLADRCSSYLRWHRRGRLLDSERLLEFAGAGSQLLHDGPARGARVIERLSSGELPVRLDLGNPAGPQERMRAVQLAAAATAAAALFAAVPDPMLGANLATAALVFAGVASLALVDSLRRLAR